MTFLYISYKMKIFKTIHESLIWDSKFCLLQNLNCHFDTPIAFLNYAVYFGIKTKWKGLWKDIIILNQ